MDNESAPYHAHIYYVLERRGLAEALRVRLSEMKASGTGSRSSST